jgi:hypothetical protein
MCVFCRHFDENKRSGWTCAAFPERIPEAIMQQRYDHRTPFPGDHDVRFTPIDQQAAQSVMRRWGTVFAP